MPRNFQKEVLRRQQKRIPVPPAQVQAAVQLPAAMQLRLGSPPLLPPCCTLCHHLPGLRVSAVLQQLQQVALASAAHLT